VILEIVEARCFKSRDLIGAGDKREHQSRQDREDRKYRDVLHHRVAIATERREGWNCRHHWLGAGVDIMKAAVASSIALSYTLRGLK
jgi:hypothetical protein